MQAAVLAWGKGGEECSECPGVGRGMQKDAVTGVGRTGHKLT